MVHAHTHTGSIHALVCARVHKSVVQRASKNTLIRWQECYNGFSPDAHIFYRNCIIHVKETATHAARTAVRGNKSKILSMTAQCQISL